MIRLCQICGRELPRRKWWDFRADMCAKKYRASCNARFVELFMHGRTR